MFPKVSDHYRFECPGDFAIAIRTRPTIVPRHEWKQEAQRPSLAGLKVKNMPK